MTERLIKYGKELRWLKPNVKVLLAVSGGLDSTVMCELFSTSKISFAIVHCNFSLRGKESDGDADFVKKLAAKYNAPFHSVKFDTLAYAEKNKLSVQQAARKLRYNWFEEVRKKNKYHFIATAHHLNDSIETFFINVLRSTGLSGLKGIPPLNGKIIRPLLFYSRAELESYAIQCNLKWRHDSSNDSDDYLRNRIRHHLIPLLEKLQPSFETVMSENLNYFRETHELFQDWIERNMQKAIEYRTADEIIVNVSKLKKDYISMMLFEYFKDRGVTMSQAENIADNYSQKKTGGVFLTASHEALLNRSQLIVRKKKKNVAPVIRIEKKTGKFQTASAQYSVKHQKAADFTIPKESAVHCFDENTLRFPLIVRQWNEGDAFFPLGMNGKKKVSDFLVNKKISRFDKENIFVILSGQDIVCILGHRIDDRYKITAGTKKIMFLEPAKK